MMTSSHRVVPSAAPYMVPQPRASDAVGEALRRGYADQTRIPDDMTALLAAIDQTGCA